MRCSTPARSRSRRPTGSSPSCSARSTAAARASRRARLRRLRRPSCSGSSPTARSPAPSPSRCSRSCSRAAKARPSIVEKRGLKQTSDTGAIDAEIDKILAANADKVERVQGRQAAAVRLLRRPDDEGDGRQGQPAAGQRAAAGEAGLSRHPAKAGAQAALPSPVLRCGLDPGLRRGTRRSMRKFVLAAAAALLASQSAGPARRTPPKLLVVISIDQFSANLFDEYRPQFTGGLARLASGTVFRNGYQSHAATETCPGHSTILTGDHPARTGIINNIWIDQSIAGPTRASIAPRTRPCPAPARPTTRSRPSISSCRPSAS